MKLAILGLLSLLVVSSGLLMNNAFGEVSENSSYHLEGSVFAATEEIIRHSAIDMAFTSHQKSGSSIDILIENGFITLDNQEFEIFR